MQRNFIAWYLNGSAGGDLKDAALVAFVAPDTDDWRFSLVKMEYAIVETPGGRVKAQEQFTPARRYSFLVGKNEATHTAQSRLVPLIEDDVHSPSLAELEASFNVEIVTREFFDKYRDLFLRVKETLDTIIQKDASVAADFTAKRVDSVDFAKKLLGQIVFLYFLQRKGWFGVKRRHAWGSGSRHFLRELFEKRHSDYKEFFDDILEPLFYEALRVERPDDYYSRFDCRIPFLNGGLFDPINNYDWVETDIVLPNELFSNKLKTKEGDVGTGILDIFDRYNFTVKEDEPLEREVAVDPEMLGKVFENLLEVKDRKSKGTYYTPREVVHYMCRESLISYLTFELGGTVAAVDIDTLIRYGETVVEHDTRVEAYGKETRTYSYKLPEAIRLNARILDDKLATIRICDPAVGSGAFPVGMMGEVIRARSTLTPYLEDKGGRTLYDFKRHAVQNCLYGVDIDAGAVEIAKLRLWLSLVVDEQDIRQIKPLPNLDYKIVQGDSLSRIPPNLFNQSLFAKLEELKPLFFNETQARAKQGYKRRIDDLIRQLTNNNQKFDFEIYFSEVFHEKGGFDVVVANPPYVSYGLRGGQKMSEGEKLSLRSSFPNSAEYKISLYAIFMDKAIQIAKPDGGVQTFIVPDSFLLGRYFSKIRAFILQSNNITSILLLPYGVFKATVGFSVVYTFQRVGSPDHSHKLLARMAKTSNDVGDNRFNELSYEQAYFRSMHHSRFRLFFDRGVMDLIGKIERGSIELGAVATGRTGVRSLIGQKQIVSTERKGKTWQRGLSSGSRILKYWVGWDGDYINIDPKVLNKGGWDYDVVHNPKILIRQTGDSVIAAIDYDGLYHLNNIHSFTLKNTKVDLLYLLALLNSRLLAAYYKHTSLEAERAMAQTDIETLECLPIKEISKADQQPFIALVERILAVTKDVDYPGDSAKKAIVRKYEEQIDRLVYKLYGITPDEIAVVEGGH
jgi:type I restriction-modification system DNA methylase subunit